MTSTYPERVLVTGGAGFIGSNFVHHLLHARAGAPAPCCPDQARYDAPRDAPGLKVLTVDKLTYAGDLAHLDGVSRHPGHKFERADVCDASAMDRVFRAFRPDAVVHFAAETHVDRSIEAGDVFVRTNVLGTQTLLDAARRHDVRRFVHVGTDEVYGSAREGSFREGDPLNPSSPYSASKAGSDLLALAHRHTYGLPVLVTRCTNNYGPRQNPEKLLPKTITLARRGEPIPVYGTGMNVRDWLYVKDHCGALDLLLTRGEPGEVYNVGADDERPNLDVVREILRRLGKPESLVAFVKDRPGHDWRYSLDSSKLRALGWAPRTPFADGLSATIRWFEARGR
ncbi:MAG TPA: dTDP-glucose 4,6-dehydratase [Candidatus Thermoplasmatota archaeon]|nr:dTDP-glucose 4,6-dehydratase [Candidatus Thermoplasmatota archaeon]